MECKVLSICLILFLLLLKLIFIHIVILTFLYSPPLLACPTVSLLPKIACQAIFLRSSASLLRKEGANHRYAEHYESILRNISIFQLHNIILRSEPKNLLKGSDFIINLNVYHVISPLYVVERYCVKLQIFL